jgi:hypothetical protein
MVGMSGGAIDAIFAAFVIMFAAAIALPWLAWILWRLKIDRNVGWKEPACLAVFWIAALALAIALELTAD